MVVTSLENAEHAICKLQAKSRLFCQCSLSVDTRSIYSHNWIGSGKCDADKKPSCCSKGSEYFRISGVFLIIWKLPVSHSWLTILLPPERVVCSFSLLSLTIAHQDQVYSEKQYGHVNEGSLHDIIHVSFGTKLCLDLVRRPIYPSLPLNWLIKDIYRPSFGWSRPFNQRWALQRSIRNILTICVLWLHTGYLRNGMDEWCYIVEVKPSERRMWYRYISENPVQCSWWSAIAVRLEWIRYIWIHLPRNDVRVFAVAYHVRSENNNIKACDNSKPNGWTYRPPWPRFSFIWVNTMYLLFMIRFIDLEKRRYFTHKPRGCISTIRSLTRSPISLIHPFTRSRSFASGHETPCNVDDKSFFI